VTLHDLHAAGAWVVIVTNALVGGWALAAHWHPRLRVRAIWVAIIVAEVLTFGQVISGVFYKNVDEVEPQQLHELYGFSALFAIAFLYAYRNQLREKQYLLYGLGSLFIMGLGIRELFLRL
jgi:hypothetical protein